MNLNKDLLDLTNELANLLRESMQTYYDFQKNEGSDQEEWNRILEGWMSNDTRLRYIVQDLFKEVKDEEDIQELLRALIAPRPEYLRQTTSKC